MALPRRPIKIVDDQDKALSWVTLLSVAAIVALGVVIFLQRDRIFPPETKVAATPPPVAATHRSSEVLETKLIEGRDLIVGRKFNEAASILHKLEESGDAQQPMRNWMNMNAGLAFYLAGKPQEAQAEFAKVEKRAGTPDAPKEPKLASFFLDVARRAASDTPVPADVAKDYDKTTYEAFALLTFAIKDWDLGDFDNAGALFRQFSSSTPQEASYMWLRRYRPLAEGYVDSFVAVRMATDAAKEANAPEKKKQVLTMIQEAKKKLGSQASLGKRLDDLESELKGQVASSDAAMAKAEAALVLADAQALTDLKGRVQAACPDFRFSEAQQIAFTATVDSDKAKAELNAILKRTEYLTAFKSTLIEDINAKGYAQPLTKKDGSSLPGGLRKASETQVETPAKGGTTPMPWSVLSVDALVTMANSFLKGATGADAAERKLNLGVFLIYEGKPAEGGELLREAAKAKPEFQKALDLFPEIAAAS